MDIPNTTTQRYHIGDSRSIPLSDGSVQLIVTSPPYPMVQMWDKQFASMSPDIANALESSLPLVAYEYMHLELDKVWKETHRLLADGGFCCINIGDATRTHENHFRMYHNHSRIIQSMTAIGFTPLPDILWRKPNNSPTKFMGSGMLPAGAYVTYEHEYILIFRKGGKRVFNENAKRLRSSSAYFWEERNQWFTDIWSDIIGAKQSLTKGRKRSAAFPFELSYRLINMYSIYGDTVLDPFLGTGTTLVSSAVACRNGIGIEALPSLAPVIDESMCQVPAHSHTRINGRLDSHRSFIDERRKRGKSLKYNNPIHNIPVVTSQEQKLCLLSATSSTKVEENKFVINYKPVQTVNTQNIDT
jgi:modification methylase